MKKRDSAAFGRKGNDMDSEIEDSKRKFMQWKESLREREHLTEDLIIK